MQATVHRFDPDTASGSVLTDNGREIDFGVAAFANTSLLHLRPGQRVNIEVGASGISRMWIEGIGPGQRIR
ncbi:hypothetical protein FB459_2935 [Yimella lutea]|uniref:Cold shock CspA family protein n=1 Tax=Yimella lutea TaxID=587872 RepID=A0A542EJ70_9MICO|nr:hypothetical protein [Yimella lutea]TQJ15388.1 hypothetical protein FB459_2935 [Yimella lutea]